MKKISTLLVFTGITFFLFFGCNKNEDKNSKVYSDYITVEISSVVDSPIDPVCKVQISNTKNIEFENESILLFNIYEPNSGKLVLSTDVGIINKKSPGNPSFGLLNIQKGGNYIEIYNLRTLKWVGDGLDILKKGNYDLTVTLFIKDLMSPANSLVSNKLVLKL